MIHEGYTTKCAIFTDWPKQGSLLLPCQLLTNIFMIMKIEIKRMYDAIKAIEVEELKKKLESVGGSLSFKTSTWS